MIIDAILGLLKIVLDVVLLPLTPLNFVINLGSYSYCLFISMVTNYAFNYYCY